MYAIRVQPNKYRKDEFYLMRDFNDFVVHVWTRKSEAERMLTALNDPTCSLTTEIPKAALDRAVAKKQNALAEAQNNE